MQTRNNEGEGYALFKIEESIGNWVLGPGVAMVEDGMWTVGGVAMIPGEAVILHGPSLIAGLGLIGVVEVGAYVEGAQYTKPTPAKIIRHDKPWGYELEVIVTGDLAEKVQFKRLRVNEDSRTSLQIHNEKDEVMAFFGGDGVVEPEGEMNDEGFVHVPPKIVHRVAGPRDYFEASTYHPTDVVRLEDDYGRDVG